MTPPKLTFVVGIEDRQPFIWQLAILLESLEGQLPVGWNVLVVICNDDEPISGDLRRVFDLYGCAHRTAPNHSIRESIDFAESQAGYAAINKITAMGAAAEVVDDDGLICLLDTDIFLYRDINLEAFPTGNALTQNHWLDREVFYSNKAYVGGVDLPKLLESIGVERPLKPGAVIIFLTGKTLKQAKIVDDCYRFTQIVFLFGRIVKVVNNWVAEMPAYALSLTANDVPYEITARPEFSTETWDSPEVVEGTFYHYYRGEGAFWGSPWNKATYGDRDLLLGDLDRYERLAQSDHERWFFATAARAAKRMQSGDKVESVGESVDENASGASAHRAETAEIVAEPRTLSPTTRLRRAVGNRLRYLKYHVEQASNPGAPGHKELDLPFGTRVLYRVLAHRRKR